MSVVVLYKLAHTSSGNHQNYSYLCNSLSSLYSMKGMLPDLSPHLHTKECNFLIELLKQCNRERYIGKYFGKCSFWDEAVWQCTKKERIWRRDHNPRYSRRVIELRNLPEDYWTPTLHKLKADGVMPDLTHSEGCRL